MENIAIERMQSERVVVESVAPCQTPTLEIGQGESCSLPPEHFGLPSQPPSHGAFALPALPAPPIQPEVDVGVLIAELAEKTMRLQELEARFENDRNFYMRDCQEKQEYLESMKTSYLVEVAATERSINQRNEAIEESRAYIVNLSASVEEEKKKTAALQEAMRQQHDDCEKAHHAYRLAV